MKPEIGFIFCTFSIIILLIYVTFTRRDIWVVEQIASFQSNALRTIFYSAYKTTFLKEKQLRFRSEVKVNEDGLFNIEFLHSRGTVKVIDRIVYN